MKFVPLSDISRACAAMQLSNSIRIEAGLRGVAGDGSLYSGSRVVNMARELLALGFREQFPIEIDPLHRMQHIGLPERINDYEGLVTAIEPILKELENKLASVNWPSKIEIT